VILFVPVRNHSSSCSRNDFLYSFISL